MNSILPHPVDRHVGSRMRARRRMLGFSQTKLGHAVGISFQQVQKHEQGINRIGASRLYEVAQILDVPVAFFFEGLGRDTPNVIAEPDAAALSSAIHLQAISEPALRKAIDELIEAAAVNSQVP